MPQPIQPLCLSRFHSRQSDFYKSLSATGRNFRSNPNLHFPNWNTKGQGLFASKGRRPGAFGIFSDADRASSHPTEVRFRVLATDYDGTLATHGAVEKETIAALERLRKSGRKLLLVTGRELPDLKKVFPEFGVFDRIVAENGALLFRPSSDREALLCEPPVEALIHELRQMCVPVSVGRAIIATTEPHYPTVLAAIHRLGLELQLTFNKGSLMVLPSGVNKATGLGHALKELGITAAHTVAIGDAENDHAFLAACGCGVAVANALPSLKSRAQVVTRGAHGAGVVEVIDELLANDFARGARCGSAD